MSDYAGFIPIAAPGGRASGEDAQVIFRDSSPGVGSGRDRVLYDFSEEKLRARIRGVVEAGKADRGRNSRRLPHAEYAAERVRPALYRPYTRRWLYLDEVLCARVHSFPRIFPGAGAQNTLIAINAAGAGFRALVSDRVTDAMAKEGSRCFPFYGYDEDGTSRRENITDWAWEQFLKHYRHIPSISKWSIFDYVYGMLHHPGYRERFAENLKRELPRIPFGPDFRAFQRAGQKLIRLHLDYEKLEPWKLEIVERPGVPLSWRVEEKMRLSKDGTRVVVNPTLTLGGIPPEVFEYRLGNRSALEWVIDQYQVSTDKRSGIVSDPNRGEDPEYVVRLVGQVVRVSVETVAIVRGLPGEFA